MPSSSRIFTATISAAGGRRRSQLRQRPGDVPAAGVGFPPGESDAENLQGAIGALQVLADNDQLGFYADEAEVVPGIQAIATHGHSPGHMSFLIDSNGDQLLHLVDSVLNNITAVQRPDWFLRFDAMPEMAVESRRSILGRAADEQVQVFGYHFSFPGSASSSPPRRTGASSPAHSKHHRCRTPH